MRKIKPLIILFLITIILISCKETKGVINSKSGLVLRTHPTISAERIDLIPNGAEVSILNTNGPKETIYGITDSWYEVKYNDKRGWSFGGLIAQAGRQKKIQKIIQKDGYIRDQKYLEAMTQKEDNYTKEKILTPGLVEQWWVMAGSDGSCIPADNVNGHDFTPSTLIRKYPGCYISDYDKTYGVTILDCKRTEIQGTLAYGITLESCKVASSRIRNASKMTTGKSNSYCDQVYINCMQNCDDHALRCIPQCMNYYNQCKR